MREIFNLFGICFHIWGAWYARTPTGWRLAQPGEPATRSCDNCNAQQRRG